MELLTSNLNAVYCWAWQDSSTVADSDLVTDRLKCLRKRDKRSPVFNTVSVIAYRFDSEISHCLFVDYVILEVGVY